MARVGIIMGDETIEIAHEQKGVLYKDLAYVNWDSKKEEIMNEGSEAKKLLNDLNNSFKVIKLFNDGTIVNTKALKKLFDKIFLPLKSDLETNEIVVGIPTDSNSEIEELLTKWFKEYKLGSLTFIPNIYLLALGAECDVQDEYGTIILNFGYGRTSVAIISNNKVINFGVINLAEDFLTNELLIFFKEHFQLIIEQDEINLIKYDLASLTTTRQPIQTVINGQDLLTNVPRKISVTDLDVKKVFTSLFSNYRSIITKLLEDSPTSIRTGITKNGLIVTGNLAKIHGVEDYFTGFFEFPTKVVNEIVGVNDALKGALTLKLNKKKN